MVGQAPFGVGDVVPVEFVEYPSTIRDAPGTPTVGCQQASNRCRSCGQTNCRPFGSSPLLTLRNEITLAIDMEIR